MISLSRGRSTHYCSYLFALCFLLLISLVECFITLMLKMQHSMYLFLFSWLIDLNGHFEELIFDKTQWHLVKKYFGCNGIDDSSLVSRYCITSLITKFDFLLETGSTWIVCLLFRNIQHTYMFLAGKSFMERMVCEVPWR